MRYKVKQTNLNKLKNILMPIPKPKANEKQKDFIVRCVAEISKEYKKDQAVAICYQTYRDAK